MNKKAQSALMGWGAFVALAVFLLIWGVLLGSNQRITSGSQDNTNCVGTATWNATAQRCYNVLSVDNYSATSNQGFVFYNMTAGNLNAAGQTTTLTSVGIGVGIIALVMGVIFLVRKSGVF